MSRWRRCAGGERFPEGAQLCWCTTARQSRWWRASRRRPTRMFPSMARACCLRARQSASDPWQIWELTLADRSLRKVIATATDAERPLYLPGGRLVWAERTPWGFQLESAEDGHAPALAPLNPTAGPGVLPLTYMQASAIPDEC